MKVGQTFTHVPSGQTVTTSGVLGGIETLQTSVPIFGDEIPGPDASQYGLQGFAKPIDMMRRGSTKKAEQLNKELDSSEKYTKEVKADKFMKARVDNSEKTDDWYKNRQKSGYYTEKLGPIFGKMDRVEEIKMNERLVQEHERQHEIYKKNEATRVKHQKVIDKKIKPHLDKINSGLDKKIDLRTLYQRGAVVNDDGTRGLMIRRETKSAMGLSLTKTVITSYRGKNLSTVGSVANREKLGITGQGKMTKVAEIKDPRLIEYKMPVELEMWQSQSVDPKGATTRSVGAQIASKVGVKSAFDVLNYYIDNHVLNFDPNFDPNKRHNLTHLITDRTKDILQKGMNNLKPEIDAEIEKYKSMIPRIGEKQARSLLNDKLLGDGKANMGLINSYFRSDSTINNKILQKIQRVDIFNSLGNNLGFDIDHYIKTGNYGFDSTYKFTSTLDMGVRVPVIGGVTSILSRKYVSGQLYGETMMAVQNPMQFRVDIESDTPSEKAEPDSKQATDKEPSKPVKKIKSMTKAEEDAIFKDYMKAVGIKHPELLSPMFKKLLRDNMRLDIKDGTFDPQTKKIKSMSKTRNQSKAVQTVKKMASSKSVGFDRDDLSFKKKKNFREWSQQLDDMWNTDWKDNIDEGMTTQMLTGILPSAGDTDLDMLQLGATGSDLSYVDGADSPVDGEFTALVNTDPITSVTDPLDVGTHIRSPQNGASLSLDFTDSDVFHTHSDPGDSVPGDDGGTRGSGISGNHNSGYVNDEGATNENIPFNNFNGEYLPTRVGTHLAFGNNTRLSNAGFPRYAALKAVDTTEMDTLSMNWFCRGAVNTDTVDGSPTQGEKVVGGTVTRMNTVGDGVSLFYWAGDKEGAATYAPSVTGSSKINDGWRPINVKPDGTTDNTYSPWLIPHKADVAVYGTGSRQKHSSGYPAEVLLNNKITLPPWCRDKNTRFLLHQGRNAQGAASANFGITSVRFQRRSTMKVRSLMKPLTDIEAAPFVRVGQGVDQNAEQRRKKIRDMIKASIKYGKTKFGDGLVNSTNID